MSKPTLTHDEFIARQAVFLHRQGLDANAVDTQIAAAFGSHQLAQSRARLAPASGGFRAKLADALKDLAIPPEALDLRGLALEQSVAESYLGLWRGMTGFATYTLGVAAIATLAFTILQLFVVPQLMAVSSSGGTSRFAHLVFEAGLGGALLAVLWILAIWTLLSIALARRAILLRDWPAFTLRFNLLRSAVLRHRVLLGAWTTSLLIDHGLAPAAALERSAAAINNWCASSDPSADAEDATRLAAAAKLGTLAQELEHRIAGELADAPLALAAFRERLALYTGIVSAILIVPLLIAMYLLIFMTATVV